MSRPGKGVPQSNAGKDGPKARQAARDARSARNSAKVRAANESARAAVKANGRFFGGVSVGGDAMGG
jgi:hypothetical protein